MSHELSRAHVIVSILSATLSSCGGGGDAEPRRAFATLTSGEAAQVVIGQANFNSGSSNHGGPVAANGLLAPSGDPAVVAGRLYLPDTGNNRVLVFNTIPTVNDAPADFVLGQSDMSSNTSGRSASKFSSTGSVSSSSGRLALVDGNNWRVVLWSLVPTSNVWAAAVVGKSTFSSGESACDAKTLFVTDGAIAAGGKLIVSDQGHNRVLVWNAIPTNNYEPANLVLGQPDFTTCGFNTGGLSASSMNVPGGVWSDGVRLFVADTWNNRVLVWNAFPTANGQAADRVLGQPSFTTSTAAATASGMNSPMRVASNGTQIAVADYDANRVLVWNQFPNSNGAAADVVLGQADFTSGASNTSASGMWGPSGVLLDGDLLIVSDGTNNRTLIFK